MTLGRSPEPRYSVHRGYVDALVAVGATPLLVPCAEGVLASSLLAQADALLVTGGGDIAPARYQAVPTTELMEVDDARDAVEVELFLAAHSAGVPVLGICRGIQLLAAALGGSLVQDLPTTGHRGHWDEERQHEPVHAITAEPGSLALHALGGATSVNSIHHQAVATTGPRLRATAWSDDGVIEAVEAAGVLGVQWHPERLFATDARHLAPFRWLVGARDRVGVG